MREREGRERERERDSLKISSSVPTSHLYKMNTHVSFVWAVVGYTIVFFKLESTLNHKGNFYTEYNELINLEIQNAV